MNSTPLLAESGISWREVDPASWLVTIDGDKRVITQDERGFVAWIGHQSRHWNFGRALQACIEDVRYAAYLHAKNTAEQAAAEAHNAAIPREHRIAALELECELLNHSDDVNACARQDRLRAQLEAENVHA